jgi:hypothetical protein
MSDAGTIQSLWLGSRLPMMQRLSISSFLANGHNYHLYAYESLATVPEGTQLKDANEIVPRSLTNNLECDSYAHFSDMFRYRLLFERGGWWADTDVVCLRPFAFPGRFVFSSEHRFVKGVLRDIPTTTVMRAPSGSETMDYLYTSSVDRGLVGLEWNEIGSTLLAGVIDRYSLRAFALPPATFCPIPMYVYNKVLDTDIQFSFESSTYAVHLWHEFWRRRGLDVEANFEPDCLYEQFKAKFLLGHPIASKRPFVIETVTCSRKTLPVEAGVLS